MQEYTYRKLDGEIEKVTEMFNIPANEKPESVLRARYERAMKKVFGAGGEMLSLRQGKIGRNDPCPCGSGRKFKRCCESKINVEIATNGY